jgi:hypothetical protein
VHSHALVVRLDAQGHRVRVDLGAKALRSSRLCADTPIGVADSATGIPDRDGTRADAAVLRIPGQELFMTDLRHRKARSRGSRERAMHRTAFRRAHVQRPRLVHQPLAGVLAEIGP